MKRYFYILCLFLPATAFAQWTPLMSGTTNSLNSVYFINTNTGYVAGDSGTILKTINGGISWSKLSSGTMKHLASVYFTSDNTGVVVGDSGTLLKTSDA